MDLFL